MDIRINLVDWTKSRWYPSDVHLDAPVYARDRV